MLGNGVGREGYILNTYTLPKWRGLCIGAGIVRAIVEHARAEDLQLALLATDAGHGICERAGFEVDLRYMRWR